MCINCKVALAKRHIIQIPRLLEFNQNIPLLKNSVLLQDNFINIALLNAVLDSVATNCKKSCDESALSVATMKDAFWNTPLIRATKEETLPNFKLKLSIFKLSWDVMPAVGRTRHSDLGGLPSVMSSFSYFIFQQSSIVIFICHLEILVYPVFVQASQIVSCGMLASAQFLFSVLLQYC